MESTAFHFKIKSALSLQNFIVDNWKLWPLKADVVVWITQMFSATFVASTLWRKIVNFGVHLEDQANSGLNIYYAQLLLKTCNSGRNFSTISVIVFYENNLSKTPRNSRIISVSKLCVHQCYWCISLSCRIEFPNTFNIEGSEVRHWNENGPEEK